MPAIPYYNGQIITPPDYMAVPAFNLALQPPPPPPHGYVMSQQYPFNHHAHLPPPPPPQQQPYSHNNNNANNGNSKLPSLDHRYRHSRSQAFDAPSSIPSYSSNGTTFYMSSVPLDQMSTTNTSLTKKNSSGPVTGGVSATLDYNIEDMALFLATMAYGVMVPNPPFESRSHSTLHIFTKFVSQLLTATRLPKETIILALVYLSKRWALGNVPSVKNDTNTIYKMLVVALLLANKFHDDNTFTNKSWFEATGITVSDLTLIEAHWLCEIKWSLHLNESDMKGWSKWYECWEMFLHKHNSNYQSGYHSPTSEYDYYESERQYTIPQWYQDANSRRSSHYSSRSMSSTSSQTSLSSLNEPFVSYFQQSFTHPHQSYEENRHSNSYYLPYQHGHGHGHVKCNCSICFEKTKPIGAMGWSVAAY